MLVRSSLTLRKAAMSSSSREVSLIFLLRLAFERVCLRLLSQSSTSKAESSRSIIRRYHIPHLRLVDVSHHTLCLLTMLPHHLIPELGFARDTVRQLGQEPFSISERFLNTILISSFRPGKNVDWKDRDRSMSVPRFASCITYSPLVIFLFPG